MSSTIPTPNLRIPIEPLTQASFASFGTVIENPARSQQPSQAAVPECVSANQRTALKYLDVTHMPNFYHLAPSKEPAKAVVNMFVCSPRALRPDSPFVAITPTAAGDASGAERVEKHLVDVDVLERHPFTSQTFIPLGLSSTIKTTKYLVVVAPTLPTSKAGNGSVRPPPYPSAEPRQSRSLLDIFSRARASPFTNEATPPSASPSTKVRPQKPQGAGLPDLNNVRAFLATGSQAVTYGAGTWHAPMVVLGQQDVDFVVVQYSNGVTLEDCQEVRLNAAEGSQEAIAVALSIKDGAIEDGSEAFRSKL